MRAAFVSLALAMAASARPMRRDATALANGQATITLNTQYQSLTTSSPCTEGEDACVNGKFSQCVSGSFVLQSCAAGTICAAIPLDSPSSGTLTTCTTQTDLDTRLAAVRTAVTSTADTGSVADATSVGALSTTDITTNATADSTDAQSSLLLDSRVIATGFLQNGQSKSPRYSLSCHLRLIGIVDVQEAGQVASLTSNNNFINYCLTQSVPITNGLQLLGGSCNPAPIGTIPAVTKMPSSKFSNPANGDTIPANTDFTISMNVNNLITGNFVNADESYFAAPQQVDASSGQIIGHTHVVMELLSGLGQTTPTNPQVFAFFKGVDTAAVGGAVTVDVTAGVPDGAYRLCSINSSSNHQPVIVPVAQHGALDDCVYPATAAVEAKANAKTTKTAAKGSASKKGGK
ncbi:hypothetical protein BT96DRAFT_953702 [Gymnopus androsaceus JB14]|uniref:Carbohydrate-binding module family 19 domain-containing protein n=1 Tax=Gymnopus androsaceus JB14 TaxID=1447944 RepID=A0A6A4IFE9_9AGAR|nr:hypothetical protein BT96DRAFT_953702 [Gymnopus androsaceus JB14]